MAKLDRTTTERFEARISSAKKSTLKNAAAISGTTLTDFVINKAYEAAVHLIDEYQTLRLAEEDRAVFINALLTPPMPSEALLKAAKKFKKDVRSQ